MASWSNEEIAEIYAGLIRGGVEFIVIGGQAVNLWSEHYAGIANDALATKWTELRPFTSADLDLLGGRLEVLAAAEVFGVKPILIDPLDRAAPPNSGTLYVPVDRQGHEREEVMVQFLHTPYGARREEIRATARELIWRGLTLPVMHPLLCLESKVECFFGLDQRGRQDLKHIRLSIACVAAFLQASIQEDAAKVILSSIERLAALAADEYGIRLRLEQGADVLGAIPIQKIETLALVKPKLGAFLEKRWPQLRERVRRKEEAWQRRFPRGLGN